MDIEQVDNMIITVSANSENLCEITKCNNGV
jgi:hypothetical protein